MRQAIGLGLALAVLASVGAARADGSFPKNVVEQGRYLAIAGDCVACHTAPGGKPFAGGYSIESPLGTIYASNITPSRTAGIGTYTEAQFSRALREGVRADGAHLYPAMPYTSYTRLSDADIHALYAYFMQGVAEVDEKAPETNLPFPFSVRASMAAWNALYLDDRRFDPIPTRSPEWNRGAYLAEALEHCSACHTPRGFLMAEQSSRALAGAPVGSWYAPNITPDPISGIGGWSREELITYLKTGAAHGKSQAAGGMAEAVTNSLQHLTDSDLAALATYLKEGRPLRDKADTRARYDWGGPAEDEAAIRSVAAATIDGPRLYSRYCASCHQASGSGTRDQAYPSLYHNTATGNRHADNLVAVILYGVDRTAAGTHTLMPRFDDHSYAQRLNDTEVAAVSNYVIARFGDPSIRVTPQQVADARRGGPRAPLAEVAALAPPVAILAVLTALAFWLWRARKARRRTTAS